MKIPFKDILKRLENIIKAASTSSESSFIKANKQLSLVLGIAFAVSAIALICYWQLKERPYYEKLLFDKDALIKTLKFTRDKQRKIYENAVDAYEKKIKDDYILKSIYDDKIEDYEQKLNSYKNDYISKGSHEKQIAELETRIKEETLSGESVLKEELEQKITALEQKISLLKDKNQKLTAKLEESLDFIKGEKETLEGMLVIERKKAFIPSLILPETKSNTLSTEVLNKLVVIKSKLSRIGEMGITLKPDTYYEMGLVSYYNNRHEEAIEQWEYAVSLNKNNLKAYICLGIVYHEENMSDNAIKVLKRAEKIGPKYATLHLTLARIYEQKGSLDDAIYEYSKVLEINPNTIDIHYVLGTLYEKKGQKEEARNSFAKYEKLKTENK